jgi:hypothetical protein
MYKSPDEPFRRVEVITSVQRRRRWSVAEKVRLVEEAMQPGMSVIRLPNILIYKSSIGKISYAEPCCGHQPQGEFQMNNRTKFFMAAVAPVAVLISPTYAQQSLSETADVHGHTVASIAANLAEYQGLHADQVEAWGDKIMVYTRGDNGPNRLLFLNKDTLRPVAESFGVGTRLDVVGDQPANTHAPWTDEPARSLLDSDDDDSSSSSATSR